MCYDLPRREIFRVILISENAEDFAMLWDTYEDDALTLSCMGFDLCLSKEADGSL